MKRNTINNNSWSIPFKATNHQSNNMQTIPSSIPQAMLFLHASLFSPTKATLTQAIQNNFLSSWPLLTTKNIKHLPFSSFTHKGHMDQCQMNSSLNKTKFNQSANLLTSPIDTIYTDQTGPFPNTAYNGDKLLFILYHSLSNAILAFPIKSKQANELLRAYTSLLSIIKNAGYNPKLHILDNEAPNSIKNYDRENKIEYQLAPPYCHRINASEREIRTYKTNLLEGIEYLPTSFPI